VPNPCEPSEEPSDASVDAFKESIFSNFADVNDPRKRTARVTHTLSNVLFMTLCAVLCGANNTKEIVLYAKSRHKWLESVLDIPHGIPCYNTFWWVLMLLDPKEFNEGFVRWASSLAAITHGQVLAIDGKALRGTARKGDPNSFVHMVSLWAAEQGLTLAQVRVDDKSNEITAIPKLLSMLDISGSIVTIDAMGTQTAIAELIHNAGADYVLALKGNQSQTHGEVINFFEQAEQVNFEGIDHEVYHTIEEGHGRYERRTVYITEEIDWLPQKPKWAGLRSLGLVVSERTVDGKTSIERRHYLSTLGTDARKLAYSIRSHWGIENACHWVLDVAFKEDAQTARAGHIAENLAVVRRMALNLLKQDRKTDGGIELKRKQAGWDPDYLLRLLRDKSS